MPTGADGGPIFCDFTNREGSPSTQTNRALANLREIKKAFIDIDLLGKFNLSLNRWVRGLGGEEFFLRQTVYFNRNYDENKSDFKFLLNGIFIGGLRASSIGFITDATRPKSI